MTRVFVVPSGYKPFLDNRPQDIRWYYRFLPTTPEAQIIHKVTGLYVFEQFQTEDSSETHYHLWGNKGIFKPVDRCPQLNYETIMDLAYGLMRHVNYDNPPYLMTTNGVKAL